MTFAHDILPRNDNTDSKFYFQTNLTNYQYFFLLVLRVWDVLLFDGNCVMLFRTALALMELYGTV